MLSKYLIVLIPLLYLSFKISIIISSNPWYNSSKSISGFIAFLVASITIEVLVISITFVFIPVLSVIISEKFNVEPISPKINTPFPSSISFTISIALFNTSWTFSFNDISKAFAWFTFNNSFATFVILVAVLSPCIITNTPTLLLEDLLYSK